MGVCAETLKPRPQVCVLGGAVSPVLELRDNVVFEANTAVWYGGAVSPEFDPSFHLHIVVVCYTSCEIWLDSLR